LTIYILRNNGKVYAWTVLRPIEK